MKPFARMMRVVGVALALSVATAGTAHASIANPEQVPFGWPVVADQDTTPAGAQANTGALIKLNPMNGANPGVQTVVAPDGVAIASGGTNYFVDPTGVVQREDQVYDVADESATGAGTGAIIEVNLVTGKQTLLASGGQLVNPTALVVDPVTDDIYVLDRSAGTGGTGAIFRVHDDGLGGQPAVTMIHDGGAGVIDFPNSLWQMKTPRGMDIAADGHLIVADRDASPNFYTNGTIFDIDPNGADPGDGSLTPRRAVAWDANGAPNTAGQFLLDPHGVVSRPDGIYIADSKDNKTDSSGGVIRIDPTTGLQTFVAGGFGVVPPAGVDFFRGALFGISPVDPTWSPTPPNDTKSDDLYVLDADYADDSTGMVGVVNPTNPDFQVNQVGFGANGLAPFSFNGTTNNLAHAFLQPRSLVTSRNLPDPPVISVNTGAGDTGLGGAQIIEPADGSPPGQASCGAEGDAACRIAFNIRLSNAWKRTVKVNYVVTDGNAGAADYTNPTLAGLPPAATPLTATFAPGQTVQTVYAPVKADLLDEPDETINITLSAPVNSTLDPSLARRTAIGTILDNDLPPVVSATSPAPFEERNTPPVACHLHLDAPSGRTITVNWSSGDGSAVAPGDYTAATTSVSFPPGQVDADISLLPKDDLLDEDSENFFFNLTGGSFVTVPAGTKCTADVLDNDDPPQLTIKDVKSNEGNSGQRQVTLSVVLSSPSGKKASVAWATKDDAATLSNKDYVQASGIIELQPGETSKSIVVKFVGDTTKEQDEPFKVVLSNPVNAGILSGTANVTIVNDDSDTPAAQVKDNPPTTGGTTKKVCASRRSFRIRVKKTKLRTAKVKSAKVYVNTKLVTTRKGKRLTAPVVLKGLKKGTYRVVIKAKLTDGRTVTDVRIYHTCVSKSKSKKK